MSTTTFQLVTVTEAADALGLSRSKVYELLAAGELPSVRIGRTRRIAVADLERFVERHRTPAADMTTPTTTTREAPAQHHEATTTPDLPTTRKSTATSDDALTLFTPVAPDAESA